VPLEPAVVESLLLRRLGVAIAVEIATDPIDPGLLTPGERGDLELLRGAGRREEWLTGRAALKRLCARLGECADTAALRFPSPWLSLTHARYHAVAVAAAPGALSGLGVDLECGSAPRLEAARLFLTPTERAGLAQIRPERSARELLRLWTVKECVFKADPCNKRRLLADYALAEPFARVGRGVAPRCADHAAPSFLYASLPLANGYLSVAIHPERPLHA
jgi:4'-phosphopantetheinyl transferase EntD